MIKNYLQAVVTWCRDNMAILLFFFLLGVYIGCLFNSLSSDSICGLMDFFNNQTVAIVVAGILASIGFNNWKNQHEKELLDRYFEEFSLRVLEFFDITREKVELRIESDSLVASTSEAGNKRKDTISNELDRLEVFRKRISREIKLYFNLSRKLDYVDRQCVDQFFALNSAYSICDGIEKGFSRLARVVEDCENMKSIVQECANLANDIINSQKSLSFEGLDESWNHFKIRFVSEKEKKIDVQFIGESFDLLKKHAYAR